MSAKVALEYLEHVQADLDAAWSCARGERPSLTIAAYHVQQAAEKLIKAALVAQSIDPPYTHNLHDLSSLLGRGKGEDPRFVRLTRFTAYAIAFHYPGEDVGAPIPTTADIDAWVAEIEALKADFERSLAARDEDAQP